MVRDTASETHVVNIAHKVQIYRAFARTCNWSMTRLLASFKKINPKSCSSSHQSSPIPFGILPLFFCHSLFCFSFICSYPRFWLLPQAALAQALALRARLWPLSWAALNWMPCLPAPREAARFLLGVTGG